LLLLLSKMMTLMPLRLLPLCLVPAAGETYVEALVAHGTDVMEEAITAMRAALPPGTRVLFIIEGAADYIGRRMKAADAARRRGAVPPPTVTQDGYDAANMHLYVTVELEAKETVRAVLGALQLNELPGGVEGCVPLSLWVGMPGCLGRKGGCGGGDCGAILAGRSASGRAADRRRLHHTFAPADSRLFLLALSRAASPRRLPLQTSTADTVEYLQGLTRAIAEYPYRMQPNALAVVTKVKVQRTVGGSSASAVSAAAGGDDDDDDGVGESAAAGAGAGSAGRRGAGKRVDDDRLVVSTYEKNLTETWMAQLQMIPGVSAVKAAAIVARYPTLRSLVDQYRDPALPQALKEGLLEDAMLDRSGKKMGKLSRDVYRLFTTRNPEELIGAAAGK
jgi:hypothetical protein